MQINSIDQAKPYDAARHFGMHALRLHGYEASDCADFWVGLSTFLPGGGAERGASPTGKVYVVIEGRMTVSTDDHEAVLGPLDSCYLAPGETRTVENRTNRPATMLVISPYPGPAAS